MINRKSKSEREQISNAPRLSQNDAGHSKGGINVSPTTVMRRDPTTNMTGEAVVFLAVSIVLGMVFGADTYSITTGVVMLALVAAVYFAGIRAV
jgi:hypothetical protein